MKGNEVNGNEVNKKRCQFIDSRIDSWYLIPLVLFFADFHLRNNSPIVFAPFFCNANWVTHALFFPGKTRTTNNPWIPLWNCRIFSWQIMKRESKCLYVEPIDAWACYQWVECWTPSFHSLSTNDRVSNDGLTNALSTDGLRKNVTTAKNPKSTGYLWMGDMLNSSKISINEVKNKCIKYWKERK